MSRIDSSQLDDLGQQFPLDAAARGVARARATT